MLLEKLEFALNQHKVAGLFRHRQTYDESWLSFASNDYLGLSMDKAYQTIFSKAFLNTPTSSSASNVVGGYHRNHQILIENIKAWFDVDDALILSSGYLANLSVIQCLRHLNAVILMDKGIHASFYEGLRCYDNLMRFHHGDNHHMVQKIADFSPDVIITEGVFSMSGYQPNLSEMIESASNIPFCVDEAHAFGVLGRQGLGAVAAAELTQEEVPLRVIPLGKALAFQGAIIIGKQSWIDAIVQFSRSYVYSTAISPALVSALTEAFPIVFSKEAEREKLQALVNYFNTCREQTTLNWQLSDSPIQYLITGDIDIAMQISAVCHQHKILCFMIRTPTVSKRETGVRFCLNATHTKADIDRLFEILTGVNSQGFQQMPASAFSQAIEQELL